MTRPRMRNWHPLAREIALVLMVKLVALVALYMVFFGPANRPALTPEAVDRAVLGAAATPRPASAAVTPPRSDRDV